jgi:hypothetical protein
MVKCKCDGTCCYESEGEDGEPICTHPLSKKQIIKKRKVCCGYRPNEKFMNTPALYWQQVFKAAYYKPLQEVTVNPIQVVPFTASGTVKREIYYDGEIDTGGNAVFKIKGFYGLFRLGRDSHEDKVIIEI